MIIVGNFTLLFGPLGLINVILFIPVIIQFVSKHLKALTEDNKYRNNLINMINTIQRNNTREYIDKLIIRKM